MTKYKIDIAQSVRAYGFVEVEADTIESAKTKVTKDFILENFEPHGHGEDDFDYSEPLDVCLTAYEDEDGNHEEIYDHMLPNEPSQAQQELRAALGQLLEQVYQMQGMFSDDDGAIQRAVDDAEKALEAKR